MTEIPRAILDGGLPNYAPPPSDAYRPTGGAGPVERIRLARPELPCPSCVHDEVCAIKARLAAVDLTVRAPDSPDPAIKVGVAVTVECRHFLAGTASVEIVPPTPAGKAAAHVAASRQRGAAGLVKARETLAASRGRSAAKPKTPARPLGSIEDLNQVVAAERRATTERVLATGFKRTPEQRERMRLAQLASIERRRAAKADVGAIASGDV